MLAYDFLKSFIKMQRKNSKSQNTCVKCLLESKLTFGIFQSISRHVKMIIRQEKAIFVGFKKIISWHSHQPISRVKKSFFQTLTRLLFWLAEFFLRIFHACYTYVKCLLESKLTIDIIYSITRQEKAIFPDLRKPHSKIWIGLPAKFLESD